MWVWNKYYIHDKNFSAAEIRMTHTTLKAVIKDVLSSTVT